MWKKSLPGHVPTDMSAVTNVTVDAKRNLPSIIVIIVTTIIITIVTVFILETYTTLCVAHYIVRGLPTIPNSQHHSFESS